MNLQSNWTILGLAVTFAVGGILLALIGYQGAILFHNAWFNGLDNDPFLSAIVQSHCWLIFGFLMYGWLPLQLLEH